MEATKATCRCRGLGRNELLHTRKLLLCVRCLSYKGGGSLDLKKRRQKRDLGGRAGGGGFPENEAMRA